jgi:hypothetical protein
MAVDLSEPPSYAKEFVIAQFWQRFFCSLLSIIPTAEMYLLKLTSFKGGISCTPFRMSRC